MTSTSPIPPAATQPESCAACGFVWEAVAPAEIGPRVAAAAETVAGILRAQADTVGQRPAPERWSVLEYASHMRDVLYHLRDRLVIGLVEDDPAFKPLYRDHRVDLGLYAAERPEVVADELVLAAGLFGRTVAAIDERSLARPCQIAYPSAGTRTVLWMAQQATHEMEHHRGDVEENLGRAERP